MSSNRKTKFALQSRLVLVIVVTVAAFLAAFLGQILITSLNTRPSLDLSQPFIITENSNSIDKSKSALASLKKTEAPSIVEIYQSDTILTSVTQGVVLTNDGWVVAVNNSDFEPETWEYIRFNSGELLPVIQVIEDPSVELVYLQVESTNLTPATLTRQDDLEVFDTLLISDFDGVVARTEFIGGSKRMEREYSSDKQNSFYKFAGKYSSGIVYNLNSELVGLIIPNQSTNNTLMVHALSIRSSLDLLLKTDTLKRAELGITYVDLAQNPILNQPSSGAYVVAIDRTILSNSIQLNDLIVSVDGNLLNHQLTLSDLIEKTQPEQTIELGLIRRGEPLTIESTLK
jgi:S1-C subfamily serine protease